MKNKVSELTKKEKSLLQDLLPLLLSVFWYLHCRKTFMQADIRYLILLPCLMHLNRFFRLMMKSTL